MLFQRVHALRRAAASPQYTLNCARFISDVVAPVKPRSYKNIFSGIQPTGVPHLGNYLGALRQWVKLQNEADNKTNLYFSIVDLHAITVHQNAEQLRRWRKEMLVSLYAVGLDPARSVIFCQSMVPQHSELMWILSCHASMGYLSRMTQWKSKLSLPENASPLDATPKDKPALRLGLFSYPVLQAADVLLYGTTHVPVGEDQAQHLEFTRELAASFNHAHSTTVFNQPETILSPAKRVMSLTNPTKKMSKSDADVKSRILITDEKDVIEKKIKSALTDSIEGVAYDRDARPGVSNLIDIMYYMDESVAASPEELARDFKDVSMRALKERVAEVVDKNIEPVRTTYNDIMAKDERDRYLTDEATHGAWKAKSQAGRKMEVVRSIMGLQRTFEA
ncbi:tryptophanyl-tRNA synthetase [Lophiotrema nucula]|uniref:Tryptophan--tRNA ligase, mitochondrial n=1 Tax=Lophiotrema nucula TaxID=690887 RepID=A0A6A5YI58_9PLEO|nr:tryptophanyl-tRNA synthetase [Lophiotrema nucula]